ncbi:APC family permease [Gordonia sp. CPCC 205515]|uniref:APC family permease n=1 Tax=Gordonia sp. CPCC 205515 TaxID=3140791 RepID=UPI003AF34890
MSRPSSDAQPPIADDGATTTLSMKRTIGLTSLIGLSISITIGSGWLLATLLAATKAGPASILSWFVAAFIFSIIGVSWLELGTMLPCSGGSVRYPRLSHGAFASWFNGFAYLLACIALPVIEAQAVVTYLGGRWPELGLVAHQSGTTILTWPAGILVGFALLAVFFVLNIFGAALMAESNKWVTIWKCVIPVATFLLMMTAMNTENFSAYGGFAPMGWAAVLGAVSGGGIVFAFNGVRLIAEFGGEAINPRRSLPIAMIVGGIAFPLVVYVGLQIGFIGAIDWTDAGVAPGDWAGLITSNWSASPLLDAVMAAGFTWFSYLLLTDALLSPAASGWVWLGLGSRVTYSMSANGELPRGLQRLNRRGSPWVALVVVTGIGFLFFLPVPSWYVFVGMVATAMMFNYVIAAPSVQVFRRLAPQLPRPIRIPAVTFFGLAGFILSMFTIYWAGWATMINVLTVTMLGLPIYASYSSVKNGWSRSTQSGVLSIVFTAAWVIIAHQGGWMFSGGKQVTGHWSIGTYLAAFVVAAVAFVVALWVISNGEGRQHLKAGIWVLPTFIFVTFLSYWDVNGPGHVISGLTSSLILVVFSAGMYFWAVRSGFLTKELADITHEYDETKTVALA